MKITPENIELFNRNLRFEDPLEIVRFVDRLGKRSVLSTSFGPYSAGLIHLVHKIEPEIPVLWCDTGYNTAATYAHMEYLSACFDLDLRVITPRYTTAFLEHRFGKTEPGDPLHEEFSKIVKIDPMKDAIEALSPDIWFSNIRKGQTSFRDRQDVLSFSETGILKVSPFYHFDNKDLFEYLAAHQLPVEFDYFDPVKAHQNRECGIHLSI